MTVTVGSDQGELSEIWIRAARIGSPADNLKMEWCANDGGGGLPGTVLKSATVTELRCRCWNRLTGYSSSSTIAR